MFPNITFSTLTFGPSTWPTSRERLNLLKEEIAVDPMVTDAYDDATLTRTLWESDAVDPVTLSTPFAPALKQDQRLFFVDMPDETLLRVAAYLLEDDETPMEETESLALTCRRLHRLTTDPTSLNKYMEDNNRWEVRFLYPEVKWTIANVKRFLKAERDAYYLSEGMDECCAADSATTMGRPQGEWSGIIWTAFRIIRALDGIRDNFPNYQMIEQLPFPLIVALHYAALVFGKMFMARHKDKLSWCRIYHAGRHERQAIIYTILRGGQVDATNLWLWDSLPNSQFDTTVRRFNSTIVFCSKRCASTELSIVRPDLWIRQQIVENKDEWLRQSNYGKIEAAWDGTDFDTAERACILACLKAWWRVVPTWLD